MLPELWWAWRRNARIGWPERRRDLHYWLGFEYALIMARMRPPTGPLWIDIGSGAHSVLPTLMTDRYMLDVLAVDLDPGVSEHLARQERAALGNVGRQRRVHPIRADARAIPLADAQVDGFTAVSSLEHVTGAHGDRRALREAARVLKPGGLGYVTVPYRAAGSQVELDLSKMEAFQRHYYPQTRRSR